MIHACRFDGTRLDAVSGQAQAVFPWWSFTKTVLATCALKLVEQGALDLDTPLPAQAFTLRQLMNHTAGLPDYGPLPAYHEAVQRDDPPWPVERLKAETLAQGTKPPGAPFRYSNLGYLLLRETVEAAAGEGLETLVQRMICGPLALDSVALALDRQTLAKVPWPGARRYHPGWVYHGCLIGTAGDAARLLHALMEGRLLSAETLSQMLIPVPAGGALPGRPWSECGYGLGLMIGRFGETRALGHTGGGPFSVNAVYHFPQTGLTTACFAEGPDTGAVEFEAMRLGQP